MSNESNSEGDKSVEKLDWRSREAREKMGRPVSPFTADGVKAGSPEYRRRYMEAHRQKQRLYAKRQHYKQMLADTAVEITVNGVEEEKLSVEDEMKFLDDKMKALAEERAELRKAGITHKSEQIPFIAEEAQKKGVSYDTAARIMEEEPLQAWDTSFEAAVKALGIKDPLLGE